ncbi:TPA: hypothetical protein ACQJJL_004239 [Raoultella ornithinolytica]
MDKLHFSSLLQMKEMNKRFALIAYHTDQLSAVLVIHMVSEKTLETWIEAKTHNKDFFSNSVNLTFNNKLLIAKNFSLPNDCFVFLKTLNSIRNKFAHQIEKTEISESEIEKLYDSLSGFIKRNPNKDPKLCKLHTRQGTHTFNDNNNIKLSLIFSSFYLSLFES